MSRLMDIYGDRGSGKTILLTFFGVKSNQMNIPVIADFKLKLPNYIPLKIDELATLKYRYATVEFDEIDIYLNNRRSMSNLSLFINNMAIKQSRKRGIDILGSTQLFDTIDWRFTELTNMSILAFGVVEIKGKEYFHYNLILKSIFGNRLRKLYIPVNYMETLYDVYDTDEPIIQQDIKEMALSIADQKTMKKEVKRVGDKILANRTEYNITDKRLTEKKIRYILLQLEESETLAYYLSEYLNNKLGFD